jgi:hypothetical protein
MAVQRYVVTAAVTVPPGAAATVVAGEPGTGGAAGYGSAATASGPLLPIVLQPNQVIMLDPAGALYTAIGAGNLRAFIDGQDTVGHAGLHNYEASVAANGRMVATNITIAWDGGVINVPAGTVVDVPAGSALEAAYGVANLVPLTSEQDTGDTEAEPDVGGEATAT